MSAKTKTGKILAFDWDARTLRVVHASVGKRGARIDRLLSVAVPADVEVTSPEQMGRLIRQALDQEGITTRHAIVDVPREQAILNTLNLPVSLGDELPSIVAIQIAKQLPFAVADAVIDFVVAPHASSSATSDVLVAAVRHDVLTQLQATFAAAGLRLERIGLRPFANKIAGCELLRDAMPDRVLFIDVRPTLTEINVLKDSFLAFSRAASVHIDDEASEPAPSSEIAPGLTLVTEIDSGHGWRRTAIASLVAEVTRSIEAYRAADATSRMDHAVIAGGTGLEEELAETIQQRLGVTAELYNPARTFHWDSDEGATATAFSASLGLVLGHSGDAADQFDFIHPKKTVTAGQRRLRKAPLVTAVVALFLSAGVVAAVMVTRPSRQKLALIEQSIKELQESEKANAKFVGLVNEVRKFDRDQQIWVDVLYDVISVLPQQEQLVINQIELKQKERQVVLKTKAKKKDVAVQATRQLNDFKREGSKTPRFKAGMGVQSEKPGELYPTAQDLRISILEDDLDRAAKKAAKDAGA